MGDSNKRNIHSGTIEERIKDCLLRWFWHAYRRPETALEQIAKVFQVQEIRKRNDTKDLEWNCQKWYVWLQVTKNI